MLETEDAEELQALAHHDPPADELAEEDEDDATEPVLPPQPLWNHDGVEELAALEEVVDCEKADWNQLAEDEVETAVDELEPL